jgi:betaine-aldehyde dehydrogenase
VTVQSKADKLPNRMFVDGQWTEGLEAEHFDSVNPATEEILATLPRARSADIDRAVISARRAFDDGTWVRLDPKKRARFLFAMAAEIRARREEFACAETLDCGKTLAEARYDVDEAAATFEYYGGWTTKIDGDIPPIGDQAMSLIVREPVGVCGLITAWNYPLLLASWKIAPALAAGCTVVVKPAEQTPLTTLMLGQVAQAIGLPSGVLNIVTGFGIEAGAPLVEHPDVDKISFTGSRLVGIDIMKRAAGTLKRLTLELGGKSPNIVFADAPFEQAIAGTCAGIFGNQGQICSAGSRVLVERSIYDAALAAFVETARALVMGDGLNPDVTLGPLVSDQQRRRVQSYIDIGQQEGARLAFSGSAKEHPKGWFVPPTIFADVDPSMRIAREEIFGPVMAVIPFDTVDDAIRIANDTEYGLAAALWTTDMRKALRVGRVVRAGTVWINDAQISPSEAIWGGFKQSGFGRELGRYGLDAYLERKQIYINLEDKTAGQKAD